MRQLISVKNSPSRWLSRNEQYKKYEHLAALLGMNHIQLFKAGVPIDATFSQAAAILGRSSEGSTDADRECPECHEPVERDSRYCKSCGAKMPAAESDDKSPNDDNDGAPKKARSLAFANSSATEEQLTQSQAALRARGSLPANRAPSGLPRESIHSQAIADQLERSPRALRFRK